MLNHALKMNLPRNYFEIRRVLEDALAEHDPRWRDTIEAACRAFDRWDWPALAAIAKPAAKKACSTWRNRIERLAAEMDCEP